MDGDPYWYKDADHLRAARPRVPRQRGRRRRRLPWPRREARLPEGPGRERAVASSLLSVAPARRRVRHLRLHQRAPGLRDARATSSTCCARRTGAGLRVITELVLNHTSDQHPWFQAARRAPRGDARIATSTCGARRPSRYRDARIIFKDFEPSNWSWDPVAGAYYWHRFYSHQPDLNWDNPAVWKAMLRVLDFWLEMGVDGLRLDAVPYLYEREGTSCENLPETHATLKALRRHVDRKFSHRVLLAEANQWPEDAAAYFGTGDESHMAFHFPLMPRMFMALHMEDRYPIIDILSQTPALPGGLPVGALPAQPRRADPGDGHGRGARLHVPRLRPRPAGPHQPRDPAAPGSAAGERPPPHRADDVPPPLAAGHARPLLRRRDRHGRQHLPRRPQRRAHADAVERRPQRGLLAGQPAAPVPARHHRSRLLLRGGERPGPAGQPPLAALVDAAAHRPAPALPGFRAGEPGVPLPRQPQGAGFRPPLRAGDRAGGGEPLAPRPVRRAGPRRRMRESVPVEMFGGSALSRRWASVPIC